MLTTSPACQPISFNTCGSTRAMPLPTSVGRASITLSVISPAIRILHFFFCILLLCRHLNDFYLCCYSDHVGRSFLCKRLISPEGDSPSIHPLRPAFPGPHQFSNHHS